MIVIIKNNMEIKVAQANFRGPLLNQKILSCQGKSICPRKRDSSTYMIIHIFFVQMLQLPSQSVEQRTEKSITEATLIPWIAGLRGPIYCRALHFAPKYHVSLDLRRPQIRQHIHYSLGQSIMCLQIHAGRKFDTTRTTIM